MSAACLLGVTASRQFSHLAAGHVRHHVHALHHPDPAAIGADPGWAVAQAPFVFLEALFANLKAAGAVPAEGELLLATMADKAFLSPAAFGIWDAFAGHETTFAGGDGLLGGAIRGSLPTPGWRHRRLSAAPVGPRHRRPSRQSLSAPALYSGPGPSSPAASSKSRPRPRRRLQR